jgi:uncharacterized integral membrane protein
MKLTSVVGTLIAIVAITFAFQNNDSVTLQFFSWVFTESVALLILAAILTGFIIGMMLFLPGKLSATWKLRAIQKENEALKKTLSEEAVQYESEGLGKEGDQLVEL